jgi:hypothetical protein
VLADNYDAARDVRWETGSDSRPTVADIRAFRLLRPILFTVRLICAPPEPDCGSRCALPLKAHMPHIIAYFDPGAGSLLMQALVGGAAGLLVFGRYLWESLTRSIAQRRRQNV